MATSLKHRDYYGRRQTHVCMIAEAGARVGDKALSRTCHVHIDDMLHENLTMFFIRNWNIPTSIHIWSYRPVQCCPARTYYRPNCQVTWTTNSTITKSLTNKLCDQFYQTVAELSVRKSPLVSCYLVIINRDCFTKYRNYCLRTRSRSRRDGVAGSAWCKSTRSTAIAVRRARRRGSITWNM